LFEFIKGNIHEISPAFAVLEANGVGYHLNISLSTYEQVKDLKSALLLTHFHVTENSHTLYGFHEASERALFRLLISISGIGPNTARQMLSSMHPSEIKSAIVNENVAVIKSIKGIGPKTAQRVILELKDKVKSSAENELISGLKHNSATDEALSALLSLGFSKADASKAIDKALKNSDLTTSEALIKQALKSF